MDSRLKALGSDTPVTCLPGLGPKKKEKLSGLGIDTIQDLLYSWPRNWEDRRNRVDIAGLRDGVPAGFEAVVSRITRVPKYYAAGKQSPFTFIVSDDSAEVEIVFFNARWTTRLIETGRKYIFFGTPLNKSGRLQLIHPEFQKAEDEEVFASHPILPVYPLKKGLNQKDLRLWHELALSVSEDVDEPLPHSIVEKENLCGLDIALRNIHFPASREELSEAKYRLVFEELFLLQCGLMRLKLVVSDEKSGICFKEVRSSATFEQYLPFDFTAAQKRTIMDIYQDMESKKTMNRLVQGDVGSGKTAVAAAAVFKAVKNGYQAVMMAPTEILAKQHYADLSPLFQDNGICSVALFTSGMKTKDRREAIQGLTDGSISFAIGTHALLQPDIVFNRLGLVITDEQHRFGVDQRINLAKKNAGDFRPDILVMTATPIPRSLAFVLYGDLDVSLIDELPPGRKRILTKAVADNKRRDVYAYAKEEVEKGRQIYVVAPLIEDTDSEVMEGVRSAETLYDELKPRFAHYRTELLHGNMKQDEKDRIMNDFVDGNVDVLISTVVIEVGVNVPNASMMIIESAERFGLAQLHQLRGRVGRGAEQSYCVLVSASDSEDAKKRIEAMVTTDDGFIIAEQDLSMRGPGEIFGTRQHGIPSLRIADLAKHLRIAEKARNAARSVIDNDPMLKSAENSRLKNRIDDLFSELNEVGL